MTDGIVFERVDTQGNDQGIRRMSLNGCAGALQRRLECVHDRCFRQRQIQIESLSGADTPFAGIPREIRIGNAWVSVNRYEQHVGSVVEDILCAVAMMEIDVENRQAARAVSAVLALEQAASRDSEIAPSLSSTL